MEFPVEVILPRRSEVDAGAGLADRFVKPFLLGRGDRPASPGAGQVADFGAVGRGVYRVRNLPERRPGAVGPNRLSDYLLLKVRQSPLE